MTDEILKNSVIGIDIIDNSLHAHILPGNTRYQYQMDNSGINELFHSFNIHKPLLVVMSAEQGVKLSLAASLANSGLPIIAVNPRQVENYNKKFNLNGGSARKLASFAEAVMSNKIGNIDGFDPDALKRLFANVDQEQFKQDRESEKIISDKYSFIYVGVPKVATRSILTALYREPQVDVEGRQVATVLTELLASNEKLKNYYKFTFVRNPWARVVSCYHNKIKNPSEKTRREFLSKFPRLNSEMRFQDFVNFLLNDPQGRDSGANRHWLSQYKFICDAKGEVLVDYIGKLENLEEDFTKVTAKLGLSEIKLPWLNSHKGWKADENELKKRNPLHYREYYSIETKELVAKRYKKDIELFGYEF